MRLLVLLETGMGSFVMGHGRFAAALRSAEDVEVRFVGLPPLSGIAARAADGLPRLRVRDLDAQVTRWLLVQSARARRTLERELARFPADAVVVVTHSVSLLLGGLMRRVPVLLALDATAWDFRSWGLGRPVERWSRTSMAPALALERRALARAALVVAWSEWAAVAAAGVAPGANVIALHPGLDLDRYRPAVREPRERPRVLFVGGRMRPKGGDDLLLALGPRLGRDVEVDLVTRDDVRPRHGLRVHRLGPDDPGLIRLFQQADLLAHPSHGDAVPWAVLEALACGTCVVATPVGAIPELLDHERAGRLVPVREPAALGDAIAALLADGALRRRLGAHGRARCEARFDARVQSARLIERVEEAVSAWR